MTKPKHDKRDPAFWKPGKNAANRSKLSNQQVERLRVDAKRYNVLRRLCHDVLHARSPETLQARLNALGRWIGDQADSPFVETSGPPPAAFEASKGRLPVTPPKTTPKRTEPLDSDWEPL